MFFIKLLRSLYNTFAGAMSPTQIAYGMCLGFFVAMMPFGLTKAHTLAIVVIVLLTRASIGLFFLTGMIVKPLMAMGGDALAWHTGNRLLENPSLKGFWTNALNAPVIALFEFDKYRVLGGFVLALVCAIVFFFPIRQAIVYFRTHIQPRADQYRIIRWWRGFWLTKALSWVFVGGGQRE